MRTSNAFTLIELMVTLAVIAIIATLSMPKVEEWVARQQARLFISQLIADYSKARTLAGSYFIHDASTGSGARTNQAALYFQNANGTSSYSLLTRNNGSTAGWPADSILVRKTSLPSRLSLKVVHASAMSENSTAVIALTSAGIALDGNGKALSGSWMVPCGGKNSNKRYSTQIEFRAAVHSTNYLYYRVELNPIGEYRVCVMFNTTDINQGTEMRSI